MKKMHPPGTGITGIFLMKQLVTVKIRNALDTVTVFARNPAGRISG
jgi:hypothetical protein